MNTENAVSKSILQGIHEVNRKWETSRSILYLLIALKV